MPAPPVLARMIFVLTRDADAHGVDEGVGGVGGGECHLPRNVRYADAVAVTADACDDTLKEVAVAGALFQWAKEEGVEQGDGSRAHAEYVTNNAADARRRALVWLDGGRVVVGFHFHDDG